MIDCQQACEWKSGVLVPVIDDNILLVQESYYWKYATGNNSN